MKGFLRFQMLCPEENVEAVLEFLKNHEGVILAQEDGFETRYSWSFEELPVMAIVGHRTSENRFEALMVSVSGIKIVGRCLEGVKAKLIDELIEFGIGTTILGTSIFTADEMR